MRTYIQLYPTLLSSQQINHGYHAMSMQLQSSPNDNTDDEDDEF